MAERIALVTGAAQGIGQAVAKSLLADGLRVALLDVDGERARSTAKELDSDGERTLFLTADVSNPEQITAACGELTAAWRSPDVLINNAGRTVSRSVWEIGVEEWDDVLATNLRSYLLFAQRCAPAMRDASWGRIINMASMAGQQGGAVAGAHYAASKAGIIVLTKILARELASHGVTVNAIAPAAIRTPAMDGMDPDTISRMEATIPVRRVGTVDEVAALVSHVCSDAAGFITGATLDINGGLSMR
jgi:3-oxoacyl-[acyl-carrier protein] reductase